MIKRKRHGEYSCLLLRRAIRAEGRMRAIEKAHLHCIKARDVELENCRRQQEVLLFICKQLLYKLGGKAMVSTDTTKDEAVNIIINPGLSSKAFIFLEKEEQK